MHKKYFKKIVFFTLFMINSQSFLYSMNYQEVAKTIPCVFTPKLKAKIACSQWIQVKKELLACNELDVFARESIEEVFRILDTNLTCKPNQNIKIKEALSQRLFAKNFNS